MQNGIETNQCQQEAQSSPAPDALDLKGEKALTCDVKTSDSQSKPATRSSAGCPYHALLDALSVFGHEADVVLKPSDHV